MQTSAALSRAYNAIATALALALCMSVLLYHGPYRQLVRNSFGDSLAVVFLYFLLGVIRPGSAPLRAAITGIIAFAIEGAQLMRITPPDAPRPVQLMFGSHFDPWDLVAYTVGIILAVAIDYGIAARNQTGDSSSHRSSTYP